MRSAIDPSSRRSRVRPMSGKARAAVVAENLIGSAWAVLDVARLQAVFPRPERWPASARAAVLSGAFSAMHVGGSKRGLPMQKRQTSRRSASAIGFAPTAIRQ